MLLLYLLCKHRNVYSHLCVTTYTSTSLLALNGVKKSWTFGFLLYTVLYLLNKILIHTHMSIIVSAFLFLFLSIFCFFFKFVFSILCLFLLLFITYNCAKLAYIGSVDFSFVSGVHNLDQWTACGGTHFYMLHLF